jgi:hypothetical protein
VKHRYYPPGEVVVRGELAPSTRQAVEAAVLAGLAQVLESTTGLAGVEMAMLHRSPARERYTEHRSAPDGAGYRVPSYDDQGRPVDVPVRPSSSDQDYAGEQTIQKRLAGLESDRDDVGVNLVAAQQTDPGNAPALQVELTSIEREILMLERLDEVGMKSTEADGKPWKRTEQQVGRLIVDTATAAKTEKSTLSFLQAEDLRAGSISSDEVTPTLLQNPNLFRTTTHALYRRVVAEMLKREKEYQNNYFRAVNDLAGRPPHDVIGDYVRIRKKWGELQHQVGRTHWDVELQPFSPLSLSQRQPASADVIIDQLDVLVGTKDVDKTVPGIAGSLGNLRKPLAQWYLASSYGSIAETMKMYALSFEVDAPPGVGIAGFQGDLVADLRRAAGNESGSTIGFLADVNGVLQKRLDQWTEGLAWWEHIIEGFWLYDLGGKVGARLKAMLTIETLMDIVGFISFLAAIQVIPYANLIIDAILLATAGRDLILGISIFATYFDAASDAKTFDQLYVAATGLQGADESVVDLIFTLATLAASKALKRYGKYRRKTKFDSLDEVAREPVIHDDPVFRKAAEEAKKNRKTVTEMKKGATKGSSEPKPSKGGLTFEPSKHATTGLSKLAKSKGDWSKLTRKEASAVGTLLHGVMEGLVSRLADGAFEIIRRETISPGKIAEWRKGSKRIAVVESRLPMDGRIPRLDLAEINFADGKINLIDYVPTSNAAHIAKTRAYGEELARLTGLPVSAVDVEYVSAAQLVEDLPLP